MTDGGPVSVVLDHTAVLALATGSRTVSRLVTEAHRQYPTAWVYVPALCLAVGVARRPGVGEHVATLPALRLVDLGLAHALGVGRLVAAGVPWQAAHAVTTAYPDAEWPAGRPVVTADPGLYDGLGITTITV